MNRLGREYGDDNSTSNSTMSDDDLACFCCSYLMTISLFVFAAGILLGLYISRFFRPAEDAPIIRNAAQTQTSDDEKMSGSGSDTEYEQPWTSHESPLFCDKLARKLEVDKKVFDSRKFYDYLTETLGPSQKDE